MTETEQPNGETGKTALATEINWPTVSAIVDD